MKMRIVKLKGGLGNQMFQYAFALNLKKTYKNEDILLDYSSYRCNEKCDDYKTSLLNYSIKLRPASKSEISHICYLSHSTSSSFLTKAKVYAESIINPHYLIIRDSRYIPIKALNEIHYFDGYWQSYKYIDSVSKELRKDFMPKGSISDNTIKMISKIKNNNYVFVGIRRGDYITNFRAKKRYGNIGYNYYINAMKKISQLVKKPIFLLFSNEIDWVKANWDFDGFNVHFRENDGTSDFEELLLMSSCRHAIIANSTFHWWGAWLIDSPHKIVIGPRNWFINGWPNNIMPPQWFSI